MLNHLLTGLGRGRLNPTRRAMTRARVELLESRWVMAAPTLAAISDVTLVAGAPLNIALDGFDADNDQLTYTATSSNGSVTTFIPVGNDSLRLHVVQKNAQGQIINDFGTMEFQLFEDSVPVTTTRFKELVDDGFYDSLTFHRIIKNFMIQGGDPAGNGGGGSGVNINDEFDLDLRFTSSGLLAAAKSGDDTVDSQFFITAGPTRWLDFQHTIFGFMTKGESVRQNIANVPTGANDVPTNKVVINSAEIFHDIENGVLRLSAPIGFTGTSTIKVTVSDGKGGTAERTFNVTVVADNPDYNGKPYLEPISDINMTVGQTITKTLIGVDAEGNAINFYAEGLAGTGITFVNDNPNVTPTGTHATKNVSITASLPGRHDFYFAVRPQGYTGFDAAVLDIQKITINVAPEAPTSLDLLPETDNGASNTDDFTTFNNANAANALKIKVSGVWQGATVTLKIGDRIIGTATAPSAASGATPTKVDLIVTTNGTELLSAGVHSIVAVQSVEGVVSAFSNALNVTVNAPTLLPPVDNKVLDETQTLSFNAGATDADLPTRDSLVYSLAAGAPAGASINASTGAFLWTPSEGQGGQTYPITIRVTDSFGQVVSQSFNVTVNDVNLDPILGTVPQLSVKAGKSVSAQLTATDADLPVNTLTFRLAEGSPAGGSITAGGLFTYQAASNQADGTLNFTVIVDDGQGGTDTKVLSVQVLPGPKLNPIGSKTINEGEELLVTVTAIGQVGEHFTYHLGEGMPAGVTIDQSSGSLLWQTTEAHGQGTYAITVIAKNADGEEVSETFQVTVNEVNQDPQFNSVANQTIDEGQTLSLAVVATDPDLPANGLTYSLDAAPAGATINPTTGLITWVTGELHGGQDYIFKVRVTDSANASDTVEFTTTVNEANTNPTLNSPGTVTVLAGQTVTHNFTATDPDVPADTLTFSLGDDAPEGATITADGQFQYVSPVGQSQQLLSVTVIVRDNRGGQDSKVLTINVGNLPVLEPISDKQIDEGGLVLFTASAYSQDPLDHMEYRLAEGAPAGAHIEDDSGVFYWQTTEADGGQVYSITVIVRNKLGLETSQTLEITVNEVNRDPVISEVPPLTVEAGQTVEQQITATDPDLPANTLTFSLADGSPAGGSITADGLFKYISPAGQFTQSVTFTIVVNDGAGGTATRSLTVKVQQTPVLDPIADREVTEGNTVLFTAAAHTTDPLNHMTYRLGPNAPEGAVLDDDTGAFVWQTNESHGPGVYTFTIIARDNHGLETSQEVQITVLEATTAPTLSVIDPQQVIQGDTLSLTIVGADADLPAQELLYALGDGAPAGVSIDPNTGVLTWSPDTTVTPGVYSISVLVTDPDGLTASVTFDVTVVALEEIIPIDLRDLANSAVFPGAAAEFGSLVVGAGLLTNDFSLANGLPPAVNSIGQGLGRGTPGAMPFTEVLAPQNEEFFFFRSTASINHLGADTGVGTHWTPNAQRVNRPNSPPNGENSGNPAIGNPSAGSPRDNRNAKKPGQEQDDPARSAQMQQDDARDAAVAALMAGAGNLAVDALFDAPVDGDAAEVPAGSPNWTPFKSPAPKSLPSEERKAADAPEVDTDSQVAHAAALLSAGLLLPVLRSNETADEREARLRGRSNRRPR